MRSAVLTSFKQSVTLPRGEGNPFLPERERLCCHANPSSSGVYECVWFYDLMTPVGSDQWVGLSVARCEFTSLYAKPGCNSSSGLVVGMEPYFWTLGRLRGAQLARKCWIGGGWGVRTGTHRALSGQNPGNTATRCRHCGTQGGDNVESNKVKMTCE